MSEERNEIMFGESSNVVTKKHMKASTKRKIGNIIAYTILILMSIIWIFPFICIVLQSFRCESTWMTGYIIPQKWGFDNYVRLFNETKFFKWFTNTTVIALFTCVIQTFMVLCMAYTLSRLRFKGRKFLMNAMLVLGMFPGMLTMIILYRVLADLKIFGDTGLTQTMSVPGLILVYTASSAMGYHVAKGFFDTIPKSLDEAARVDGANRAQVLFKIILPLAKPIVIYTLLTAFMAPWGDFVFASYVAFNNTDGMNVAVGLNNLIGTNKGLDANYTMFCAGGVIVAIPITILFICLQKYYVEGVTGGAVKG